MPKPILFLFSLVILLLVQQTSAFAQIPSGPSNLVYIRHRQGDGFQLVSLSRSGQQVFEVSHDDCYRLSPATTYLALFSPESEQIHIFRLSNGMSVRIIARARTQAACSFNWRSDSVLELLDSSTIIDVRQDPVSPTPEETTASEQETTVPHLLLDDFRLTSPDNSLIVYNRCASGEYTISVTGNQQCTSAEEIIIYDFATEQVVEVLEDTHQVRFVLTEYDHLAFSFAGISWSPSGRYLAYRTYPANQNTPPFQIYDTYIEQYVPTSLPETLSIDWFKGFVWTQNEQGLAFWIRDYEATGSRLAILDVDSRKVTYSNDLYELAAAGWGTGLGNTIVFLNSERILIEFAVDTGQIRTLDTDVWDILRHP